MSPRKSCLHFLLVAGAPIFTYTHEPDDNEIHNGWQDNALLRAGCVM